MPAETPEAPKVPEGENAPQADAESGSQADVEGAAEPAPLKGDALELARLRAVLASGIPHEIADVLGGNTAAEIEANAVKLANFVGQSQTTARPAGRALPSRPTSPIGGGPSAIDSEPVPDPAKLAAAIAKRISGR
jgi:hypothetical protein